MDKNTIVKKFSLDNETWPYCFTLEFQDKFMKLSARTQEEFNQWIRIFNLIVQMNIEGLDLCSMSPFEYEDYHQSRTTISNFEKRKLTDTQMIEKFIED